MLCLWANPRLFGKVECLIALYVSQPHQALHQSRPLSNHLKSQLHAHSPLITNWPPVTLVNPLPNLSPALCFLNCQPYVNPCLCSFFVWLRLELHGLQAPCRLTLPRRIPEVKFHFGLLILLKLLDSALFSFGPNALLLR